MIITYLRSSSYNEHKACPMRYYMSYVLGLKTEAGLAAAKGNCYHKTMELLAWRKLCEQTGQDFIDDDLLGVISPNICDPDILLDIIINKDVERGPHKYSKKDRRDIKEWVDFTITYSNGNYDPRNQQIVMPEQKFDYTINEDWAHYDYTIGDTRFTGQLSIKGTMDLIVDPGIPNCLECIDYKSGQRVLWDHPNTPIKTPEMLDNDSQLLLYLYSAHKLYPDVEDILMSIFYAKPTVRGGWGRIPREEYPGGVWHPNMSKEDLPRIERMIREKFEQIKSTQIPELVKAKWCDSFCAFGNKSVSPHNPNKSVCQYFSDKIQEDGIDKVTLDYADISKVAVYQDGGGRKVK